MAVPKRKMSKSRRDKRRANWKLEVPTLTHCPRCKEWMVPHQVCPTCGHYAGREVIHLEK